MTDTKLLREAREFIAQNSKGGTAGGPALKVARMLAKLDAALSASGGAASGAASVSSKDAPHELSVPAAVAHPDDEAVDRFAAAMKAKLAKKRGEGRGGWDDPAQCELFYLADLLVDHCGKVNSAVDIGNFAMMIWNRTDGEDGSEIPQANLAARLQWLKRREDAAELARPHPAEPSVPPPKDLGESKKNQQNSGPEAERGRAVTAAYERGWEAGRRALDRIANSPRVQDFALSAEQMQGIARDAARKCTWGDAFGGCQGHPDDCGCAAPPEVVKHFAHPAQAAAAEPSVPQGWRPIESAPLTHDVLLFCESRGGEVAYTLIDAADSDGYFIEQATHWMPLPAPPPDAPRKDLGSSRSAVDQSLSPECRTAVAEPKGGGAA